MSGTHLHLLVQGQSYLQAGDVIQFDLMATENRQNSAGALDPQYSGRYIITKMRHQVQDKRYRQVLECVKDSVAQKFSTYRLTSFPGQKPKNSKAVFQDIKHS